MIMRILEATSISRGNFLDNALLISALDTQCPAHFISLTNSNIILGKFA